MAGRSSVFLDDAVSYPVDAESARQLRRKEGQPDKRVCSRHSPNPHGAKLPATTTPQHRLHARPQTAP